MWGPAEVGAVAPAAAILTLGEWLAILDIVVIGVTPCAEEGVVTGVISPGVVKEVVGMMDLIVSQVLDRGRAVDDMGGDAVVGVGVSQGLGTLKALLSDVS